MSQLPTNFDIQGPFWTAEIQLVEMAEPVAHVATRSFYLDNQPRRVLGRGNVLVPGTSIALCYVRQVRIAAGRHPSTQYVWRHAGGPRPRNLTAADIRHHLSAGTLALLLLEANPADWPGQEGDPFPSLACVGGEISLDVMRPRQEADRPDDREQFYRALNLELPATDEVATRFPALAVHAGGVSIYGGVQLPWQTTPLAVPLQLTRLRPDVQEGHYYLSLDEAQLNLGETQALIQSWQGLNRLLSPRHPLSQPGDEVKAPAWVTLEVADPFRGPRLFWEISPWQAEPKALPLRFKPGELTLILSDQLPYDQNNPPTSLMRVTPSDVMIEQSADGTLTVTLQAGHPTADGPDKTDTTLGYEAYPDTGGWREAVTLGPTRLAFDPLQTAQKLRIDQALPSPQWTPGEAAEPVERPLLWGFMPLADGWAQLPFLNLTEQIYLDAGLAREETIPAETNGESWFQGAVSLGNSRGDVLVDHPQEQPWFLALTGAAFVKGTWQLSAPTAAGGEHQLAAISLVVGEPDIVVQGLCWLSRSRPTPVNALPEQEDWIAGLWSPPLRRTNEADLFPPAQIVRLEQLSFTVRPPASNKGPRSAQLGSYSLRHEVANEFLLALDGANVIPPHLFERYPPLFWRRHPTLPMIQAMPLTQSQTPPNYPSPSRQLVPFEPEESSSWRFGVTEDEGATIWPRSLDATRPAADWRAVFDLPLVSLSLPGLILDPTLAEGGGLGSDTNTGLPQQLRFDLPYTDELNALAQLPKLTRDKNAVSPLPDAPPPQPPEPLQRETFAEHWGRLSEQASLAAVDGVEAFIGDNGRLLVQHLIEPLRWPIKSAVLTGAYPGHLAITDETDGAEPLDLSGPAALRGISGQFLDSNAGEIRLLSEGNGAGENPYRVEAGSMAARAVEGRYRDQRGLWRAATRQNGSLLQTPVQLDKADETDAYMLTSTQAAVPLQVDGRTWRLWFRDLPVAAGVFDRQQSRSPLAQDVNDPEAQSRDFNVLSGYEWRLAEETAGVELKLHLLNFYPLTLEKVTMQEERVTGVEIIGRLQLPLAGAGELTELGNAVRLRFVAEAGADLVLQAVQLETTEGHWPLALQAGEAAAGPQISWTQMALQAEPGAAETSLVLLDAHLHFFLFGVKWLIDLGELVFRTDVPIVEKRVSLSDGGEQRPLQPAELILRLDLGTTTHEATLQLAMQLGSEEKPLLTGLFALPLQAGPEQVIEVQSAHLFGRLELNLLEGFSLQLQGDGLQLAWNYYQPGIGAPTYLLPGMALVEGESVGFAALTFSAVPHASGVASLQIDTCFVETLLSCRWGEFLQTAAGDSAEAVHLTPVQLFGSSAGNITAAVTTRWQPQIEQWSELLLLNGMVEINSLISWPATMSYDETNGRLTLPAAGADTAYDHWRHTIQILFNQHELPPELLTTGPTASEPSLLFHLTPDQSWQFLAAVEHQLLHITADNSLLTLSQQEARRWTVVQEVRIVGPALFKEFLEEANRHTPDPRQALRPLHQQDGYFHHSFKEALMDDGSPERLDLLPGSTLLVEASAPHWLRLSKAIGRPDSLPPSSLQFLPGGTQSAILSSPADYAPSPIEAPAWLLLVTPFFGRLQLPAHDGLEEMGWEGRMGIEMDPVLRLARQRQASPSQPLSSLSRNLASWGDEQAVDIDFSAFDSAVGRTWTRLDPTALEESWFRLQQPLIEPLPTGLTSIIAALPDTPARLSREVALSRAFDVFRPFYPPQTPADYELPPGIETGALVWRPDSLLLWQSISQSNGQQETNYGWATAGLQLLSSGLTEAGEGHLRYLPAATLLPARLERDGQENNWPLNLAVSPYLGLDFKRSPETDRTFRLASAELLALPTGTGSLKPIASRFYTADSEDEAKTRSLLWAHEVHRRLAPESSLAVLRLRHVYENTDLDSDEAVLITRYDFALLAIEQQPVLDRHVFRLRTDVAELRFREGQFGGHDMSGETGRSFEVAPPQATGVQPLYLMERPSNAETAQAWPWGLSALRVSLQVTAGKRGIVQPPVLKDSTDDDFTLWWHTIQHHVQYRSGLNSQPAAGLPPLFRAEAIHSLLSVMPQPPMPIVGQGDLEHWQPILPGAMRYLLSGARPGAFFALRHHLLSQQGQSIHLSGGLPLQHRLPRPVPLPSNQASLRHMALQTWASHFEAEHNLLFGTTPIDTAFFAANEGNPARGLQMDLTSPVHGAIGPDWNGEVAFALQRQAEGEVVPEQWDIVLELHDAAKLLDYQTLTVTEDGVKEFALEKSLVTQLRTHLVGKTAGSVLMLKARVRPVSATAGFEQVLVFPLRLIDPDTLPLPLRPQFIHFEDPEYNRSLVSQTGREERLLKTTNTDGEEEVHALALATDRREYNPDSVLFLRYDWDDGGNHALGDGLLMLDRISRDNIVTTLAQMGELKQTNLHQVSLGQFQQADGTTPVLQPGDTLRLTLRLQVSETPTVDEDVVLTVDIVAEPVVPVPKAAYGLLRWRQVVGRAEVECVRFAWGPEASRVELVSGEDLRQEVVRRRGLFQWLDVVRPGTLTGYAVQKITQNGATHFPEPVTVSEDNG